MSPTRLRPTGATAPDAILVGDPGRALQLAQVVLEQPMMTNHARGLWGYTAESVNGRRLTLQATGMGGPSAAAVFSDLVKLGVERAVRVGTCRAVDPSLLPGAVVAVGDAYGRDGASRAIARAGRDVEEVRVEPDAGLGAALAAKAETGPVISVDLDPGGRERPAGLGGSGIGGDPDGSDGARDEPLDPRPDGSGDPRPDAPGDMRPDAPRGPRPDELRNCVCDMQTAAVLAMAQQAGVGAAAILIVEWTADGERLTADLLEKTVAEAGRVAAGVLAAD